MYLKQLPNQQKPGKFQKAKAAFLGCLSNSTGHGLPQIVKPGNLFLNVLWAIFYAVAVSGCGFLIYQAVEQFCQFDVITMTKIKRETKMELPAVTICSPYKNTYDMIILCDIRGQACKMNNLTLYNRYSHSLYCVNINYGTDDTELQTNEGLEYGYILTLYNHNYEQEHYFRLAITDNSAKVVSEEVRENLFPGQETQVVLSKIMQTALSPPYSNCNQSTDYRQVNCIEDCDKKAMIEACGCGYSIECPKWNQPSELPEKCLNVILSKCNQECPVECKQVSFQSKRVDIKLDIDKYLIENYRNIVSNKFNISKYTDDEIKKRITRLSIFFDKFERTEITQSSSITPTSLIANVGGLLGNRFNSIIGILRFVQLITSPFFEQACSLVSVYFHPLKPLIS